MLTRKNIKRSVRRKLVVRPINKRNSTNLWLWYYLRKCMRSAWRSLPLISLLRLSIGSWVNSKRLKHRKSTRRSVRTTT